MDDGISDEEILQVLQTMVRQRHDSIEMYTKGNRDELAEREAQEIEVMGFMPRQLDDAEMETAIDQVVEATGAASIKDMGKAMGALRERYAGRWISTRRRSRPVWRLTQSLLNTGCGLSGLSADRYPIGRA